MICPLCVFMAQKPTRLVLLGDDDQAHAGLVMGWMLAHSTLRTETADPCERHKEACRRLQGQVDTILERAGLPKPLIVRP